MVYKKKRWTPWANTLIYYKFDWNLNDSSWNNNNWTAWWTITYWTNYANLVSWYVTVPNLTYNNTYTLSFWFKCTNLSQWTYIVDGLVPGYMFFRIWANGSPKYIYASTDVPSYSWEKQLLNPADNNWHLVTQTSNASWVTYYLDWVQKATSSSFSGSYTMNWMRIGRDWNWANNNPWLYAWHFIIENKARTATEISDYYNLTKSNYWL